MKDWKDDPRKVLDNVISKYILKKYPRCFTCPAPSQGVGHYMLRGNSATRFDEDNLRGQCNVCNGVGEGMREVFRARLVAEIGEFRVSEVERKAKTTVKFSKNDLENLTQIYYKKLETT